MLKHASLITCRQRILHHDYVYETLVPVTRYHALRFASGTSNPTTAPPQAQAPPNAHEQSAVPNRFQPQKGSEESIGVDTSSSSGLVSKLYSHPPIYGHTQTQDTNHAKSATRRPGSKSKSNSEIFSGSSKTNSSRKWIISNPNSILDKSTYEAMQKELDEVMANSESEGELEKIRIRMSGWMVGTEKRKAKRSRKQEKKDQSRVASGSVEKGTRKDEDAKSQVPNRDREGSMKLPTTSSWKARQEAVSALPTSQSEPRDPDTSVTKHLLPIDTSHESRRVARTRRNDIRNLSYVEAEAKLGLSSELYIGTNFASFKSRGGRGSAAEKWRRKMAVGTFERETGDKAFWVKKGNEPRNTRKVMKKDSFKEVWADLASVIRQKPEANVTNEVSQDQRHVEDSPQETEIADKLVN